MFCCNIDPMLILGLRKSRDELLTASGKSEAMFVVQTEDQPFKRNGKRAFDVA